LRSGVLQEPRAHHRDRRPLMPNGKCWECHRRFPTSLEGPLVADSPRSRTSASRIVILGSPRKSPFSWGSLPRPKMGESGSPPAPASSLRKRIQSGSGKPTAAYGRRTNWAFCANAIAAKRCSSTDVDQPSINACRSGGSSGRTVNFCSRTRAARSRAHPSITRACGSPTSAWPVPEISASVRLLILKTDLLPVLMLGINALW